MLALIGEMLYVQGAGAGAACCVIVTGCPATVTVPVRAAPLFAATTRRTEASPLPDAPEETVIQSTPLVDVQAQPVGAVTDTNTSSPAAPVAFVVGDTMGAQVGVG